MCGRRLIPPHQSLTRQLPPEGKPFQNPFRSYTAREKCKNLKAVYFYNSIASQSLSCFPKFCLPCSHGIRKASPSEKKIASSLSLTRQMRGDQSTLTKNIHSPYASRLPKEREAALCKKSPPPKSQKTSPKSTRTKHSKTNFYHARAGALGGSSREVREVWRVGTPLRKRGSCASKVFLLPPRSFSPRQ